MISCESIVILKVLEILTNSHLETNTNSHFHIQFSSDFIFKIGAKWLGSNRCIGFQTVQSQCMLETPLNPSESTTFYLNQWMFLRQLSNMFYSLKMPPFRLHVMFKLRQRWVLHHPGMIYRPIPMKQKKKHLITPYSLVLEPPTNYPLVGTTSTENLPKPQKDDHCHS